MPAESSPSRPSACVLGGGLAGLSTACRLAELNFAVTLVEKRNFLGGRTFSFQDRETGIPLDCGQHLFLHCCTAFRDYLKMLEGEKLTRLQPSLQVKVLKRDKRGCLKSSFLPFPFHFLPSFLKYPHLSLADKLRVLLALLAMRHTDRTLPHLDTMTFAEWLRQKRQSPQALQNFWELIALPTLNDSLEAASAQMGLMIFQESLLKSRHAADIGFTTVGLSKVLVEPALKFLQARGAEVLTSSPVKTIHLAGGSLVSVRLTNGKELLADAFVSALPFASLLKILPSELRTTSPFCPLEKLESAPICNLYFFYDRPILEDPFVAVLDSPLQWVFNRSLLLRDDSVKADRPEKTPGQVLAVSVSAAHAYTQMSHQELKDLFLREMEAHFPEARKKRPERIVIVWQKEATFRCTPGAQALRPGPHTSIPNFFLAGEWTQTGWPSTMESAVRSGFAAALAVQRFLR